MKLINRRSLFGIGLALTAALAVVCALYATNPAQAASIQARNLSVENELTTRSVRTEESNLADIVVDAIRNVERSDAAFMHGSAFGDATIPKGKAAVEDILKAVQYREDSIIIVKLTGAQIRKSLENGFKLYPQKSPEFLQVSGLTVSVDPGAEREKRVVDVRVGASKLDDKKSYAIAMPSPLANGALGYYKIWDKSQAIDHDTQKTVGQAVSSYLAGKSSVGAKSEERIVFKR